MVGQLMTLPADPTRAVLDAVPSLVWSGGDDARCAHVNLAWLDFTGRALEDELGEGWRELVHPTDLAPYLACFADAAARRTTFRAEIRLRRRDGLYRTVALRGTPSDEGMIVAGLDAEGHRDARDPEFFEMSLDHLCVAGFDGYWKRLNWSWTQTLGWTPEEMMSRPLIEFVHPDDREMTLQARRNLTRGVPLLTLYNRYRCKDGSYRWFGWRSVALLDRELVYAVARDVTAEREAQRAHQELAERLSATLNSIADGVIATDAAGNVVLVNPVAEQVTGWPSSEAVGRPLTEVFDVRSPGAHPMRRTLSEGLAAEHRDQSRLIARDGIERPIAYSCAPMRDADGVLSGAVFVLRDLTDEKALEAKQARLQRQLMVADRMVSVGTLAAGAAHEINNPLACILMNLETLGEDLRALRSGATTDLSDCMEMVAEARRSVDRIRKIVRELKTFSRAEEEEQRDRIDVRAALELSIDMAFNEIRHRARLVKDYGPIPRVDADESRLAQVFINLLVNAAQAIDEGNADSHEIRVLTSTDPSGAAVIEVRDTGCGIPDELLGRIFDPFFTTKPVGVGTGLGLSICHNIVSSWGGEIVASNRPEGGASFRVVLPAAAAIDEPVAPSIATAPPPAEVVESKRAVVLVVDDEPSVGASLGRLLRGHDVTVTTQAREALTLALSRHFDVILSDLMMPEMSGMELYEALRRDRPDVAERVVFITGGAFTSAAQSFLERVSNVRLYKPFDAVALRSLVEASAA